MKCAAALALAALSACSTALPPPRHAKAPAVHASRQRPRSEDKLGRYIDDALRRRYPMYDDARVVDYVQSVGVRVARRARCGACRWTFRVLDLAAVNAFSFPGGYIYVTRGMLAELDSEAELAAVLGHEVGHIVAHHSLDEHSWLDEQPDEPTRAELIHFYERSRDNEREADQLAVGYVSGAGYDPMAVAAMLSALADVERAEGVPADASPWDDHPSTTARVARAASAAARLPRGRRARARYLASIDGLAYGDNPRHGYVDAGRFVRPDAGFSLPLPEGWHSSVQDGALLSHAPRGKGLLILMRTRYATIAEARAAFFDDDVRHDELGHELVGGFSALVRQPITGEKTHAGFALFEARGHAFVLVAGGEKRWDPQVLRGLSPVADGALTDTHGRRLAVVRLEQPSTLRRLSSGKGDLDDLVVLNHKDPDEPLPAGRLVKRVVPGNANVSGRGSGAP